MAHVVNRALSEAAKKSWADPEKRARRVAAARRKWSDPAYRKRQLAAMHAPTALPAMNEEQRAEYFRLRAPWKGMSRADALEAVLNPSKPKEHAPMLCECCRAKIDPDVIWRVGRIALYPVRRKVLVDRRPVHLTFQQMAMLELLMMRPGVVRTKGELHDALGGYSRDGKIVPVQICKLRRALGAHGSMIETVWGVGFRMVDPAGPAADVGFDGVLAEAVAA